MTTLRKLLVAGLGLVAIAAIGGMVGRPAGQPIYPRAVADQDAALDPEGNPELARVGDVPDDEPVVFSLALDLPGRAALDRFLAALNDPASPDFRRFLSPEAFGQRFGLSDAELGRVGRWLRRHGFEIVEQFPQRTGLRVRATAATIRVELGVQLEAVQDGSGRISHRPVGEARVPRPLRGAVTAISGLDNTTRPRPRMASVHDIPLIGLQPLDIERAYEIGDLRAAGIDGNGEYVAVVSWDTFLDSDIATFDKRVGITSEKVERVYVGDRVSKPGEGTSEVNLDIDVIRMIAPGARILNFETDDGSLSNGDMVEAVVKDGRAKTATISWGWCLSVNDRVYGKDKIFADEDKYKSAIAAGVNVFIASGDSGPYSCRHGNRADLRLDPDATASSPSVIDVGGTLLAVREDGTYLSEAAWEWPIAGEASGGGPTVTFPRPDWQAGPGVVNEHSNGMRQSPDVSGPADCASGFYVYYHDSNGETEGPWGCGTSAASPFWAAITALIRHNAREHGIVNIGQLNPILYRLAAGDARGDLFHDVTRGANLLYDATLGWDWATGLGSPRVGPLAQAIIDELSH